MDNEHASISINVKRWPRQIFAIQQEDGKVFARDLPPYRGKSGSKSYWSMTICRVPTLNDSHKLNKKLACDGYIRQVYNFAGKYNKHIYEVLQSKVPTRCYWDLEAPWNWREKNEGNESPVLPVFDAIEAFRDFVNDEKLTNRVVVLSSTIIGVKHSHHVIFPDMVFDDVSSTMRYFMVAFVHWLNSKSNSYIVHVTGKSIFDTTVYTVNRCFRMMNQTKRGIDSDTKKSVPLSYDSELSQNIKESAELSDYRLFAMSTLQWTHWPCRIGVTVSNEVLKSSKLRNCADVLTIDETAKWKLIARQHKTTGKKSYENKQRETVELPTFTTELSMKDNAEWLDVYCDADIMNCIHGHLLRATSDGFKEYLSCLVSLTNSTDGSITFESLVQWCSRHDETEAIRNVEDAMRYNKVEKVFKVYPYKTETTGNDGKKDQEKQKTATIQLDLEEQYRLGHVIDVFARMMKKKIVDHRELKYLHFSNGNSNNTLIESPNMNANIALKRRLEQLSVNHNCDSIWGLPLSSDGFNVIAEDEICQYIETMTSKDAKFKSTPNQKRRFFAITGKMSSGKTSGILNFVVNQLTKNKVDNVLFVGPRQILVDTVTERAKSIVSKTKRRPIDIFIYHSESPDTEEKLREDSKYSETLNETEVKVAYTALPHSNGTIRSSGVDSDNYQYVETYENATYDLKSVEEYNLATYGRKSIPCNVKKTVLNRKHKERREDTTTGKLFVACLNSVHHTPLEHDIIILDEVAMSVNNFVFGLAEYRKSGSTKKNGLSILHQDMIAIDEIQKRMNLAGMNMIMDARLKRSLVNTFYSMHDNQVILADYISDSNEVATGLVNMEVKTSVSLTTIQNVNVNASREARAELHATHGSHFIRLPKFNWNEISTQDHLKKIRQWIDRKVRKPEDTTTGYKIRNDMIRYDPVKNNVAIQMDPVFVTVRNKIFTRAVFDYIHEYPCFPTLMNDIVMQVHAGNRCIVYTSTVRTMTRISNFFAQRYSDEGWEQVKYICVDAKLLRLSASDRSDFLKRLVATKELRLVIMTNTMGAGPSFEMPGSFDIAYMFFSAVKNAPPMCDMIQITARMRSVRMKILKYAIFTNGFGQSRQDIADSIEFLSKNMLIKYQSVMNHVAKGIHELGQCCRSLNLAKILLRKELCIAYSYMAEQEGETDNNGDRFTYVQPFILVMSSDKEGECGKLVRSCAKRCSTLLRNVDLKGEVHALTEINNVRRINELNPYGQRLNLESNRRKRKGDMRYGFVRTAGKKPRYIIRQGQSEKKQKNKQQKQKYQTEKSEILPATTSCETEKEGGNHNRTSESESDSELEINITMEHELI